MSLRGIAGMLGALAFTLPCAASSIADDIIDSETHRLRVVTVADGLEHPWSLAFLPDGDALVTERPGRLRVIRDGRLLPEPVRGLPKVRAIGQGGLLDLAPHPNFARNRLLYFSYAAEHGRGVITRVARARYEDGRLHDLRVIFTALPASQRGHHFGSRLLFDRAGMLYVSVGDRGEMQRAQDLNDHAGSIMRLHDDGRVPRDNPFVGRRGAKPEIYAYGVRNPQGMTLHPDTGAVWEHEHGARGGDEINVIRPGRNYGWPVITHGVGYSGLPIGKGITRQEGMEQPLHHWTPSIAPSGMSFYTGDAFPGWRGNLFVGALVQRHLARLVIDGERVVHQERLLDGRYRIRDVRQGPDGMLWLLTDHRSGQVLRLEPMTDH